MMFPRTKKNSLTKKVLSVSLIGCITVTITAAAMQPFLVTASVAGGSLKAFLIACSAILGTGNINTTSISTLNSSAYMAEANTYTASQLDSLLSSDSGIARWTAPMANNAQTVELVKGYVTDAGGDASGLNNLGRASVGENLKATIDHYYETGEIKPSIGGQTMTDTLTAACAYGAMADVAYNMDQVFSYAREHNWTEEQMTALIDSGAAFGDLQSAIDYVSSLDKTINQGTDVNVSNTDISRMKTNGTYTHMEYISANKTYNVNFSSPYGIIQYGYYDNNNKLKFEAYNFTDASKQTLIYATPSLLNNYVNTASKQTSILAQDTSAHPVNFIAYTGFTMFRNESEVANAKSQWANQVNLPQKKSPDIITPYGQAKGTWSKDNQNRSIFNFNITPQYNINNSYKLPDETTINNYIQDVQDAVNNGEPQEEIGQYLLDLIEEMKQSIPQPTEAPFPTMAPETIPGQPTEAPKPTNTPEQEQQNTSGMATTELANKFPFCIPFDIYSMMGNFVANRSAPYIKAELNLGPAGVHYIEIDMSEFDDVAALLRTLQLILFIVGLALVARKLIGAGGD